MQNFCTQIDTAPIGVQEALQEHVCVYVRLQERRAKDKDCLHTCCQLQMLWWWSGCVWRSISLQLLYSMDVFLRFVQNLLCSISVWLPLLQHNNNKAQPQPRPPPGSREKPSSAFLRIQSKRKPSQNKTKINPTSQNQIPSYPKTQSGVLWERETREKKRYGEEAKDISQHTHSVERSGCCVQKLQKLHSDSWRRCHFFLRFLLPQMTNTPTLSRSTNTSCTQQKTKT